MLIVYFRDPLYAYMCMSEVSTGITNMMYSCLSMINVTYSITAQKTTIQCIARHLNYFLAATMNYYIIGYPI